MALDGLWSSIDERKEDVGPIGEEEVTDVPQGMRGVGGGGTGSVGISIGAWGTLQNGGVSDAGTRWVAGVVKALAEFGRDRFDTTDRYP